MDTSHPSAVDVATQLLAWVRQTIPGAEGALTSDSNERLLAAAYGRAYRCFFSIKQLAERGEADDALILSRALLSIVLRSLYLVDPDDRDERERRFDRASRTYLEKLEHEVAGLQSTGFEIDAEPERIRALVNQLRTGGVEKLPPDAQIAESLELEAFYARVYRPGSDVAHFSIGVALDGFLELPDEELAGRVALEMPKPEMAKEVLMLACITYGLFLAKSERIIGHGLGERARALLAEYQQNQRGAQP